MGAPSQARSQPGQTTSPFRRCTGLQRRYTCGPENCPQAQAESRSGGVQLNFSAGKTEALLIFRGPGSRNAKREFLPHRPTVPVQLDSGEQVRVRLVDSYLHLGHMPRGCQGPISCRQSGLPEAESHAVAQAGPFSGGKDLPGQVPSSFQVELRRWTLGSATRCREGCYQSCLYDALASVQPGASWHRLQISLSLCRSWSCAA